MDRVQRDYYKQRVREAASMTDNWLDEWLLWKAKLNSPWTLVLCTSQVIALLILGMWLCHWWST